MKSCWFIWNTLFHLFYFFLYFFLNDLFILNNFIFLSFNLSSQRMCKVFYLVMAFYLQVDEENASKVQMPGTHPMNLRPSVVVQVARTGKGAFDMVGVLFSAWLKMACYDHMQHLVPVPHVVMMSLLYVLVFSNYD